MFAKIIRVIGRALTVVVATAIFVVLAAIVYSAIIYPMYLESRFDIGMEREAALEKLSDKEFVVSETLSICENGAWYGDCEAALASDSSEFLVHKIGIDTLLVIGFNSENKVSFVGMGDI